MSVLGVLVALAEILSVQTAFAAPDEIQVYTDDMNEPGDFGVELHVNYVLDGAKQSGYAGGSPSQHMRADHA